MTIITEKTATEVSDVLDRVLSKAEETLTKYGPDIIQATMDLVRMEHGFILFSQILFLVVVYFLGKYGLKMFYHFEDTRIKQTNRYNNDWTFEQLCSFLITLCCSVGGLMVSLIMFANLYKTLLALYDPKLYLLHMAIKKVIE